MGKSKYKAKPVKADGYTFGSQAEYRRYRFLSGLQQAGLISRLKIHPRYPLIVNGIKIARYYEADFSYYDHRMPGEIVEDVKGFKTAVYKLKKKLVWALHRIEIREIDPDQVNR